MGKERNTGDSGAFEPAHEGAIPSAAVMVSNAGTIQFEGYFGRYRGGDPLEPGSYDRDPDVPPADPNSLFDLASLTKPLATAAVTMKLLEEGKLSLTTSLSDFLRGLPEETGRLTVEELLRHTSGLPPTPDIWQAIRPTTGSYDAEGGYPAEEESHRARRALYRAEPVFERGTAVVYSCTGFLLLGELLSAVLGADLDAAFQQFVSPGATRLAHGNGHAAGLAPAPDTRLHTGLGAGSHTAPGIEPAGRGKGDKEVFTLGFCPPEDSRRRCVPTEWDRWRGRRVQGEVHDENAYSLGGLAGNAGLFGTLRAVHNHALRLWGPLLGASASGQLLAPSTVHRMARPSRPLPLGAPLLDRGVGSPERRGLGVAFASREWQEQTGLREGAFGHTGFTGTSLWIDPDRRLLVVVLTSRLFHGREASAAGLAEYRRRIHRRAVERFGV